MNNLIINEISFPEIGMISPDIFYTSVNKTYTYGISFLTSIENVYITKAEVNLINDTTGFKYPLTVSAYTLKSVNGSISPEEHEDAFFNVIEVILYTNVNVIVSGRAPITKTTVKQSNKVYKVKSNKPGVMTSNMLYPRVKLGFPRWSTVENNDISIVSKTLESLLSPFYDSYHKLIDLNINALFKKEYKKFISIQLDQRPLNVKLVTNSTEFDCIEATAIQRIPQAITKQEQKTVFKLSRIIYNPLNNKLDFDYTSFLNSTLYIKKIKWTESTSNTITIKGEDIYGDRLSCRVVIHDDFYTEVPTKFNKITEIISNTGLILSNYIDCRFDHYIIKDTRTAAPIVNKDLFSFDPFILRGRNIEDSRDIVYVFDKDKSLSEFVYKFDTISTNITSMYVDEHLRTIWTDGTKVYSGVLGHDLSKIISKDPSINNNRVISVQDQNTSIGDWIDINIDLTEWTPNTPMLIRITNGDSIMYYNQVVDEFTTKVSYFYPKEAEQTIELNVKVENDSPYLITVLSDDLKKSYTACSYSHQLKSIREINSTGSLCLINGQVVISNIDSNVPEEANMNYEYSDDIVIYVQNSNINGINSLDWSFNIKGYNFNNLGGTLPRTLFNVISGDGYGNIPIIFSIKRKELLRYLNEDELTCTLELTAGTPYNKEDSYSFGISLKDNLGTKRNSVTLKMEKDLNTISIPIRFTRNTKDFNYAI